MFTKTLLIEPQGESKVERAGRTCYRSEANAKPETAGVFIRGVVRRGHLSVSEHWWAWFEVNCEDHAVLELLMSQRHLNVTTRQKYFGGSACYIISGNARCFMEAQGRLADEFRRSLAESTPTFFDVTKDLPETFEQFQPIDSEGQVQLWSVVCPTGLTEEEKRIHGVATFKFTEVSRTLTHQLVRHRSLSPSQASQRYCGEENFKVYTPRLIKQNPDATSIFDKAVDAIRKAYKDLRALKIPAEDARYILPNACHSEVAVTGTLHSWDLFLGLRTDSHAQEEIREVAFQVRDKLAAHVVD